MQKAGLKLATAVGIVIALRTMSAVLEMLKNFPDNKQAIVIQALLPVFTALLGYIFAKSGSGFGYYK